MTTRALLDTNVHVYAFDRSEPAKQGQAQALLRSERASQRAAISSQVLSEFFSVVTTRIATPLTRTEARERVHGYAASWPVLPVTGAIVLEATSGTCERRLSLWGAILWVTAKRNRIPVVLSEDSASGATAGGVTFVNPFAVGFEAGAWLD